MTPRQERMNRAWNEVSARIDDPSYVMQNLGFAAGALAGSELPYSVALIVALAEKVYGHHPELLEIKRKLGLAGRLQYPEPTPEGAQGSYG